MAIDKSKAEVHVVDIDPFVNDQFCGFKIHWAGNIGFGEYTIYKEAGSDQWRADSEYMDDENDTWLLDLLLEDFKMHLIID